jgi:hypothetical protein
MICDGAPQMAVGEQHPYHISECSGIFDVDEESISPVTDDLAVGRDIAGDTRQPHHHGFQHRIWHTFLSWWQHENRKIADVTSRRRKIASQMYALLDPKAPAVGFEFTPKRSFPNYHDVQVREIAYEWREGVQQAFMAFANRQGPNRSEQEDVVSDANAPSQIAGFDTLDGFNPVLNDMHLGRRRAELKTALPDGFWDSRDRVRDPHQDVPVDGISVRAEGDVHAPFRKDDSRPVSVVKQTDETSEEAGVIKEYVKDIRIDLPNVPDEIAESPKQIPSWPHVEVVYFDAKGPNALIEVPAGAEDENWHVKPGPIDLTEQIEDVLLRATDFQWPDHDHDLNRLVGLRRW